MNLYPCAVFGSAFPDDMIDDGQDVIIFPGRNVTEALAKALRAQGLEVRPPEHLHEHGWGFDVVVGKITICVSVQLIDDDENHLYAELPYRLWKRTRRKLAAQAKVLTALDEAMRKDGRFTKLRWMTLDESATDAPGRPHPVEAG